MTDISCIQTFSTQGLRQHILCITFALPSHHLHTEPDLALVDVTAHEHLAAAATYICQLHTYMSWSPTITCCEDLSVDWCISSNLLKLTSCRRDILSVSVTHDKTQQSTQDHKILSCVHAFNSVFLQKAACEVILRLTLCPPAWLITTATQRACQLKTVSLGIPGCILGGGGPILPILNCTGGLGGGGPIGKGGTSDSTAGGGPCCWDPSGRCPYEGMLGCCVMP